MYYKFRNGLLPIPVANIFRYDTRNDHYDLRNENILINSEVRTRSGENYIRYYLPRLVNSTNQDILEKISTHSYHGFSLYIKRNVINNYAATCTIPNCYICSKPCASYNLTFIFSYMNQYTSESCICIYIFIYIYICMYIYMYFTQRSFVHFIFSSLLHNLSYFCSFVISFFFLFLKCLLPYASTYCNY